MVREEITMDECPEKDALQLFGSVKILAQTLGEIRTGSGIGSKHGTDRLTLDTAAASLPASTQVLIPAIILDLSAP
jgi:hypothetical protein